MYQILIANQTYCYEARCQELSLNGKTIGKVSKIGPLELELQGPFGYSICGANLQTLAKRHYHDTFLSEETLTLGGIA